MGHLSAAIANFIFKHGFTPTNSCSVVVREVLGFLYFPVFLQVRKNQV